MVQQASELEDLEGMAALDHLPRKSKGTLLKSLSTEENPMKTEPTSGPGTLATLVSDAVRTLPCSCFLGCLKALP